MRAGTVVVFTAALAANAIAGEYPSTGVNLDDQTPRPKPDAYQCTVHRAVALTEGATVGKREAVVRKLSRNTNSFWMLLAKRDVEDVNAAKCTSVRPDKPSGSENEPVVTSDMDYWWACRASYYISISMSAIRNTNQLRGDGPNAFHGPGNFPQFYLRNDLTFVHAFEAPPGYFHLEEGQCLPKEYPSDVVWPRTKSSKRD